MVEYISFAVITLLAGLAQGVCGFGAGILMMMVLPLFFSISRSAAVAGIVSLALTLLMIIRYRKHISIKKAIVPLLVYSLCSALAIHFSSRVDQQLLKRLFGVFLILLTAHHFLFSKKQPKAWSLPVCVAAWAFSGVCSGLFSVGGPLMVLYYLSHTDSKEEFLGTTEVLFFINLLLSAYLRARSGILTADLLPLCALGIVCTMVGLYIANRIIDRIDGARLKNIVYAGVGISGVINLLFK